MNLLKGMAGAAFLCAFTATALLGHTAEVWLLGAGRRFRRDTDASSTALECQF
jgi:hypothetical protein